MMTQEYLEKTTIEALVNAFREHKSLGKTGLKPHHKNEFGDTCLEADWRAEEAVIKTLEKNKIPITIISEEHGRVELGTDFTGVLDGLDGTNRYIARMNGEDSQGRYGTMFAIFEGANPSYGDTIVSGIMEHPTKRLFIATRHGGFVKDLITGETKPLGTSGKSKLDRSTVILIDYWEPEKKMRQPKYYATIRPYMEILRKQGFDIRRLFSTEAHYANLVTGESDILVEGTRKNNLEIAVAYGMMKQAGGVIMTLDGKDIGDKRYFEFGQQEHIPIVSAATIELAKELIRHFSTPTGI